MARKPGPGQHPAPNRLGDFADAALDLQLEALAGALERNDHLTAVFSSVQTLDLPSWYVGAGAITGTIWNGAHGFDPTHGIKDYDVVYFDSSDLSAASETAVERELQSALAQRGVKVDATNEARVHTWYHERFGRVIEPYRSSEHAIATWPTTATSIGVRRADDVLTVCAPFGLRDLFDLAVRPNKALVSEDVYVEKTTRWSGVWPLLRIIPWSG